MRIAQLAPPFESVPPAKYGGTERVVSTLTEELLRRGHVVTLFASGDSRTEAQLVPIVEHALWHQDHDYRDLMPFCLIGLGKVLRMIHEFDVVHNHMDLLGLPLSRMAPCPVVTTLHCRLDWPELVPLFAEFDDAPLVSVSDSQRFPIPRARWVATIYHGIPLERRHFNPAPQDYLAFLGRISPEKGVDAAIRIAQRAGMPLKIAARAPDPKLNYPEVKADIDYYENVVQPLLREASDVELIGEVVGEAKDELLRNAVALLFPIRWPEPFGLVMVEALACGTPVLALRDGSVPEVIEDGLTGYIRDSEDELAEMVKHVRALDRVSCRKEAERRFSPARMAEEYEQVYARLVDEREAVPAC